MKEYIQHLKSFLVKHKTLMTVLLVLKLLVKVGIIAFVVLKANNAKAQNATQLIREGNKAYNQQKYNLATEKYTNALQLEPNNAIAIFNQADAMYQLGEYEKAATYFEGLAKQAKNTPIVAKSFHNLGNAYYKQEQYEKSVEAYKQALKLNPKDKDTKYNLMMAMSKVKKNESGSKENKQQNQQNKQQQQPQNQQNKQNQQQNSGNKNNTDNKSSSNKQQQPQLSNEEAQRLLDALESEENKVQQKLNQQKGNSQKIKIQKDW